MNWTNLFQLPGPMVTAITEDIYHAKRGEQLRSYCSSQGLDVTKIVHYSVSDLIKPPRMRVLTRRYEKEIVKDVSMDVYRVLGQSIHNFLRQAAILANLTGQGYYLPEERMFYHFTVNGQVVVVSGEPDLVTPDYEIHDYKVVAVYSYIKGAKEEWEQQTNLYAFLRTASKGLVTKALKIIFILRDWNVNETVQEDYPKAGIQVQEVTLWPYDKQYDYLRERVRLHLEAENEFDDALLECTPYETWEKPETWAIKKEGAVRARKVIRTPGPEGCAEAEKIATELNENKKTADYPFFVEHRPGERTRCLRFCDARGYCNQFKEYAGAAFSGRGKEEQIHE